MFAEQHAVGAWAAMIAGDGDAVFLGVAGQDFETQTLVKRDGSGVLIGSQSLALRQRECMGTPSARVIQYSLGIPPLDDSQRRALGVFGRDEAAAPIGAGALGKAAVAAPVRWLILTRGADSGTPLPVQPRFLASFFASWVLACQAGTPQPSVSPGAAPHTPAAPVAATSALPSADSPPGLTQSLRPDPPKVCEPCEAWNAPREPFRVFGNTYYVGTAGLSAILVVGDQGAVLIDGGLSQSAPLIAENIRKLGFALEDVRIILNSHTHYDHAGGIAALQRVSGAAVLASPASKRALESGGPMSDDPQLGFGREANEFPALSDVQAVDDQQVVRLGDVALTAHFTPGHTPGGTSWTWRVCEGERCHQIVYADSFTAISAPGFRYLEGTEEGPQVTRFRAAIARIAKLPCDILLAPHPVFMDMDAKLAARQQATEVNPFIDGGACAAYAARALEGLEKRLAEEKAAPVAPK